MLVLAAALVCAGRVRHACRRRSSRPSSPRRRSRAAPSSRASMSAAFNGQPVTLADDALTRESVLTIERRTPPGPQGRAATGRTLEAPVAVQARAARRALRARARADGREWELAEARCVPAAARRSLSARSAQDVAQAVLNAVLQPISEFSRSCCRTSLLKSGMIAGSVTVPLMRNGTSPPTNSIERLAVRDPDRRRQLRVELVVELLLDEPQRSRAVDVHERRAREQVVARRGCRPRRRPSP